MDIYREIKRTRIPPVLIRRNNQNSQKARGTGVSEINKARRINGTHNKTQTHERERGRPPPPTAHTHSAYVYKFGKQVCLAGCSSHSLAPALSARRGGSGPKLRRIE